VDVVIAGGHGQVAQRLERLLAERGHRARGLVRNPDHASDLEWLGAEAVVCDLESEDDLSGYVSGADAVVFAAGAGTGSGPERKRTVDLGAAVKLIDGAGACGVRRYVMVSSIGADDPQSGPERMRRYLEAKAEADRALAGSGLDYTIVRPGGLTDDPGTGLVAAGPNLPRGEIPRDDVAAVLLAVLEADGATVGKTFTVVSGDTPVEQAVRSL
jgi:uncharacterized protein YbjT (DUF2867 family)